MRTFILFAVLFLGKCNIYQARSMPTTDREAVKQLLERPLQFPEIKDDGGEKVLGSQPNEYESTWNSYVSRAENNPIRCSGTMEVTNRVIRLQPKKTKNCIQSECNGILVDSRVILTAAHCLYGDAPKHGKLPAKIDCPENCWLARGSDGKTQDVAYVTRHAGYKQHIAEEVAGLYRHDVAVVILKSALPNPVASSEIGCIVAGKCANPKKESCWLHRFDTNTLLYRKDPVNVDRCSGTIDYSASDCSKDDTLCLFDISGNKLLAERGDSGSPIVCEEKVGGQDFFYVRGVLSQKRRDDAYLLLASADQVTQMSYRGCVEN